jgi:hypothetical protein
LDTILPTDKPPQQKDEPEAQDFFGRARTNPSRSAHGYGSYSRADGTSIEPPSVKDEIASIRAQQQTTRHHQPVHTRKPKQKMEIRHGR